MWVKSEWTSGLPTGTQHSPSCCPWSVSSKHTPSALQLNDAWWAVAGGRGLLSSPCGPGKKQGMGFIKYWESLLLPNYKETLTVPFLGIFHDSTSLWVDREFFWRRLSLKPGFLSQADQSGLSANLLMFFCIISLPFFSQNSRNEV